MECVCEGWCGECGRLAGIALAYPPADHATRLECLGYLFNNLEWAEQVVGRGLLVLTSDELGIQFLVTGEVDATGLLVVLTAQLIVGSIDLSNISEGGPGDAVKPVLINTDHAVTVDVNGLELVSDEDLEGVGEVSVGLALAMLLDSLLELFDSDFTVLVEVSELGNLLPQVAHDSLVLAEGFHAEFAVALDQGGADSQALKVVLVKETIVVNVVHVPDDVLDAVIPGVSHFH